MKNETNQRWGFMARMNLWYQPQPLR
jgi:hypothetical protein